jgi:MoxR-like ATPase
VLEALGEHVLGQSATCEALLATYMAGGHGLLEGVPGIGKTLLARTFSAVLGLDFQRIQFTPDLMPADVIGTHIFQPDRGEFRLMRGPVFTQILMADEINRTPPKTQSAMLEAMQEQQVTIDGEAFRLDADFFVVATQNPVEHEGTYPLPEAQLDRFLTRIEMPMPDREGELELYRRKVSGQLVDWAVDAPPRAVVSPQEARALRRAATAVHVSEELLDYLARLAEATREAHHVELAISPRGGLALLMTTRAAALLEGRDFVVPDDFKRFLGACWEHRLLLTAEAELEGYTAHRLLLDLAAEVEVPRFGSEYQEMPSVRVFFFLALTTLLGVVGVLVPAMAWVALFLDGLLLLAVAVDFARVGRVELVAQRRWPPLLVQGAEAEVEVELTTDSPHSLSLRLRDGLDPALAAAPQRVALEMPAAGSARWKYRVCPQRRGDHVAGPLVARLLGPWGLAWRQRQVLDAEMRRVVPQVRWEGEVGHLLLLAHRRALGQHPQRMRGAGSETYALREYLPGDPLNKIHWKATARHGRPVSREETWERGARLVILLDCARGMSGRDGTRSKLDHALAAALALTRVAAARGDRVSVLAFSDRIERTVRMRGGSRGLELVYGRLYDLEARSAEPAFDLAAEAAVGLESRRSTVVLFTSVVDLVAAELLRHAVLRLERRHQPILINLQDPELLALANCEPDIPAEAFAKISAMEILLANRRLGGELRHAGIRVVSPAADRLALEALGAYLALFQG